MAISCANANTGEIRMRLAKLALAFGLIATASVASDRDSEKVLELSGDYTIDVKVNDQPFKIIVDPDIGGSRVLNFASASKLGLKGSMIGGVHRVGPVKLTANSNVLRYDFGGITDKNRTFWFKDASATSIADGAFSASALPYKIVRFVLRPEGEGESIYTLPIADGGNNAILTVNGVEIAVGFNLQRDETLVPASTGVLISENFDGRFAGPPIQSMIRYGVERPTRLMELGKPLEIGGLPLASMLVRVSDFGDASQIKEADAADQDEIIVTAESKRKPRHMMALGKAFLAKCSALTFDYDRKQVQMSCRL
jgi:hypothetical protein